jgi:ribosomal protein S18 acetylase RimI-like enzyme
MIRLFSARTTEDFSRARDLFGEYASSLQFDLDFQNFEEELAGLPGGYAPPEGRLLLAWVQDQVAGCVALRKIDREICEMKRLYVRPSFRRLGVGRILTLAIIQEARKIGYSRMRLDTVPAMKEAQILYESLGFQKIPSYCYNPVPGAIFLELNLAL